MNIVVTFLSGIQYPIYIPKHIFNVNAHLSLSLKIISGMNEYKNYSTSQFTFYLPKNNITIDSNHSNHSNITFQDIYNIYKNDDDNDDNIVIMVMVKSLLDVPIVPENYAKISHFDEYRRSYTEEDFTTIGNIENIENIENMSSLYKIYWINYDKNDDFTIVRLYRFYDDNEWTYTNLYINTSNTSSVTPNFCQKIESFTQSKYTKMAKRRFAVILRLIVSEYSLQNDDYSKQTVVASERMLQMIENDK